MNVVFRVRFSNKITALYHLYSLYVWAISVQSVVFSVDYSR